VQAIAALFLWLQALYFIRCFDVTDTKIYSYSILEVIYSSKVFLFVFMIIIAGFANAFSFVSKA